MLSFEVKLNKMKLFILSHSSYIDVEVVLEEKEFQFGGHRKYFIFKKDFNFSYNILKFGVFFMSLVVFKNFIRGY